MQAAKGSARCKAAKGSALKSLRLLCFCVTQTLNYMSSNHAPYDPQ